MTSAPTKLSEVCSLITKGTTPTSVGLEFTDSGVRFLRVQNIFDGRVNYANDTLFIEDEVHATLKRSQILPGDVLISIAGTIGRIGVVPDDAPELNCNQAVAILRTNPQVFQPFLRHWLECSDAQRQMRGATVTGTIQNLSLSQIGELQIPLPPLPEQRRIAAILDKADALRTKRREALAQLDRLAQAIFVEMFGFYEKGQIRWPTAPLGELATDMTIGLVRSSDEFGDEFTVPYVRMNAIGRRGEYMAHLVQKTNVSDDELAEYGLLPRDILFNTRNSKELVGKTAIIRESGMCVYNNNLMRLRFSERVDAEYIAECFLTPYIQQELEHRKSGTTSVFAIYARDVKTLPIPLPPIALQQEFGKRTSALVAAKKLMAIQHEETSRLFSSLQHRAFRSDL